MVRFILSSDGLRLGGKAHGKVTWLSLNGVFSYPCQVDAGDFLQAICHPGTPLQTFFWRLGRMVRP
jgi:hypothetical protein